MIPKLKTIGLFWLAVFVFAACKKDKEEKGNLRLTIDGLENLGPTARYEGWIIVDGNPVSTGLFTVNDNGKLSQTAFQVNNGQLNKATAFVLTIEPWPDPTPAPSDVHLLGGNFIKHDHTAKLNIAHPAAIGNDFVTATGKYILATPTTAATNDELSGIWFINVSGGSPAAGLSLPTLPGGWKYEGWSVVNGKPVSTGTFTKTNMADEKVMFSGPLAGPPFPGEDFILNAPAGLTFPTNLSGTQAVITIEPFPDNSPDPFLLKPLIATVPDPARDHVTYDMSLNTGSFPTGVAIRK